MKNILIKEKAAVAFHKANADQAMRSAILARSRVEQDELSVGDWCFYWKPATTKLDPFRWRGPCLVVAVEKHDERASDIYWIVHGSSLVRCTRTQLRHESVPERFERHSQPAQLEQLRQPLEHRLLKALKPVRGPVRAVDIAATGQEPFYYPGGYASADAPDHFFDPKEALADAPMDTLEEPDTAAPETTATPTPPKKVSKKDDSKKKRSHSPEGPPRRKFPLPEDHIEPEVPAGIWTDPGPPAPTTTATSSATPSGAATADDNGGDNPENPPIPGIVENQDELYPHLPETQANAIQMYHQAIQMASAISEERNRVLDGLPARRQGDGQPPTKQPRTEEIHMVQMTAEDELHVVVESRLDAEGKLAFKEAKKKALIPWCENDAWRPVNRTDAPAGTIVPMRFLLRYKEDKPHARVILQGFKHRDVLESKLDTESPTLSRLGKYLLVTLACTLRWKLGTMDVKSAFLQADYIHHEVSLFGEPSADMRRLLQEMLGFQEHQVMQMTKPAFGDVRAPKQWNQTADKALTTEVKLLKHALDGCIYMSTRRATKDDDVFTMNGINYVVDGVLGLHVDDMIAAGENFHRAEDAVEPVGEPQNFAERMHVLVHRFRFGSISFEDNQTFCGAQMQQSLDYSQVTFNLEKYIKQIKPLTIEKNRKANPNEKATDREVSQFRGLLGGMAWPATQTQPHLSASVSLAQATVSGARVAELNEANKILRYAKETADIPLVIRAHGSLQQLRFGFYSDASWSTRPDGSSQGGWLLFLASESQINGDQPFPLTVIDWSSRKLPRVCRSSLSAEAQIMTTAVDNLEWAKTMFGLMIWPSEGADSEQVMKWLGVSPCITDARALFDASTSATPGMRLAEKRTAIEIKITQERMAAACGMMRWCNSHQQLADGVTKAAARTKLAMELRRGVHCLRYDPECVASKKVKQEDKDKEQEILDHAANKIYKQHKIQQSIFRVEEMTEEDKNEVNLCLLEGCALPVEAGKRYCCKRHYHAAQHKQQKKPKKAEAALATWMVLTASGIPGAEAIEVTVGGLVVPYLQVIIIVVIIGVATIIVFLAGIHYGRHRALRHQQRGLQPDLHEPLLDTIEENTRETENMATVETENAAAMEIEEESGNSSEMSSIESIMNRSGEWSHSTDGLGHPETYEGDIITPRVTPRLPNGEAVRSSNGGQVSWLTPAQAEYLQHSVRYVYSDAEVNERRNRLQEAMPPSIDEVLTDEMIYGISTGTLTPEQQAEVPIDPTDWHGVSKEERERRMQVLEDSLLLGIDYEEMDANREQEARALRAELRTVREVERTLNESGDPRHRFWFLQVCPVNSFFPRVNISLTTVEHFLSAQVDHRHPAVIQLRLNTPTTGPLSA